MNTNSTLPAPGDSALRGFLDGGGEMGALIRAHDWTGTPLGPTEQWPQSLKTTLGILLNSRYPMFVFWGPSLVKIYNDGYRPILGHKHPWALGRTGPEIWPEIWKDIESLVERALNGDPTWSDNLLLFMERNGFPEEVYFTFSYSPIPDESGGIGGMFCACIETTGQVLGERRLRTLRDLGSAPANARTATEVCALSTDVLHANPADVPFALVYLTDDGRTARLTAQSGVTSGETLSPAVISLDDGDAVWPVGRVADSRSGEHVSGLSTLEGRPVGLWPEPPGSAMVLPLIDRGLGRGIGAIVLGISSRRPFDDAYREWFELIAGQVGASITSVRAAEEERKRAQALAEIDRAKTTFFSNVSHELRTPLTLMLGPLEQRLADESWSLTATQREDLEVAHRNALRLQKLVNTLLEFSRIEAGRIEASYEPVDLAAFTGELASLFRSAIEKAGLRLIVECPALPEPVYVDPDMWEKVILNLLSNALKFTFEGTIAVRLAWRDDHVELRISDSGVGIAATDLPHLFERFHRIRGSRARAHEGTGIGLALVQELVRLHGGTIHVESAVDRGTTVLVSIPAGHQHLPADRVKTAGAGAPSANAALAYLNEAAGWMSGDVMGSPLTETAIPSSVVQSALGERERIVVADDNADMRDYLRRLLGVHWDVDAYGNGAAALEAIRQRRPDLVLADIMMPGLSGFELLRELRTDPRTQDIPMMLLSARAGEEARVEGMEGGADDYVVKPFSARELVARLGARLQIDRIRREAHAAISASERKFSASFAHSPLALTITSLDDGRFVDVNEGFVRISGYARDEVVGRTPDDLGLWVHSHQRVERFQQLRSGKSVPEIEARFRVRNGDERTGIIGSALVEIDGRPCVLSSVLDITERRHAADTLHRTTARLESALEAGLAGTFYWDIAGDRVITDENMMRYFSLSERALQEGVPLEEVLPAIHDEDRPKVAVALTDAIERTGRYQIEYRVNHSDGRERWLSARGGVERTDQGQAIGLPGFAVDITDRKEAEKALQESEERYRAVVESQAEMVCRFRPDGTILFINSAYARARGTTADALIGANFWEFVVEEERPNVRAMLDRLRPDAPEVRIENQFETAEGPRWTLWTNRGLTFDSQGCATEVQSTGIDITDRKRRERHAAFLDSISQDLARLSDGGEMMRHVAEKLGRHLRVSRCVFAEIDGARDQASVVHDWNDAHRISLIGTYRLSEFIPHDALAGLSSGRQLVVDDTAHDTRLADKLSSYLRLEIGAFVTTPHVNDERWIASLTVHQREPRDWKADDLELVRNVASRTWTRIDRARAEQRLRESEAQLQHASQMKDEFLATLSHELRTPLNAVLGWAHMLRTGTLRPDIAVRALDSLERNAKAQTQLVDDLLDMSRIVSGKLQIRHEPVDLSAVIASAVDTVRPSAAGKGVALEVLQASHPPIVVNGDADRLRQIVWNLLSNAIKFTPTGGRVQVTLTPAAAEVEIVVRDTGEGIGAEFLPFVFDRFKQADGTATRRHGGLGLGLAIVRHLTEAHGGTAGAESEGHHKGAVLTIRLPAAVTAPKKDAKRPRERIGASVVLHGIKILIVDDEADARELLQVVLETNGAEVSVVQSAGEALHVLQTGRFDVVLADIGMPEQDGLSFIRAVRSSGELNAQIAAVAVTAYASSRDRDLALEAGYTLHLAKPVNPEQLVTVVAEAVQAKPRRSQRKRDRTRPSSDGKRE